jgi:predicted O-methyltransferase YrrM
MCDVLRAIGEESKKTAAGILFSIRYARINNIYTHLSVEEKSTLLQLAGHCNGQTYVEIGSFLGASSCCIAEGIRSAGKSATLYCVDTWQNDAMGGMEKTDTYPEFQKNTQKYAHIIVPVRGTSREISGTFHKKIDLLFLDADNPYEGVKQDVEVWFPKLRAGAMVIFHDIGWARGVQQVIQETVVPRAENGGRLWNMYWARIK